MLSQHPLGPLGDWEEPAIRWAVRQAIAERRFRFDDEDELTNSCVLHWMEVRSAYNPERGAKPKTYLNIVTRNYLIDLHRRRSLRERRNVRLDTPIGDDDLTLGDLIADDALAPEAAAARHEMEARTRQALSLLEGRALEVALGLMEGKNVTDLSNTLGISRQACYRAVDRIGNVFRDQHLHEFLR